MLHDVEAVVAWKHWKHLHALGAERRTAAEAMGSRLRASRQAEMRRRDEEAMRAERKKNLAEQRKKRRDEDWRGFRPSVVQAVVRHIRSLWFSFMINSPPSKRGAPHRGVRYTWWWFT